MPRTFDFTPRPKRSSWSTPAVACGSSGLVIRGWKNANYDEVSSVQEELDALRAEGLTDESTLSEVAAVAQRLLACGARVRQVA